MYQSEEKRLHTHQNKTDKFSKKYVRLSIKKMAGCVIMKDLPRREFQTITRNAN